MTKETGMDKEFMAKMEALDDAAAEAGGYVQPSKPMTEEERLYLLEWIKQRKIELRNQGK